MSAAASTFVAARARSSGSELQPHLIVVVRLARLDGLEQLGDVVVSPQPKASCPSLQAHLVRIGKVQLLELHGATIAHVAEFRGGLAKAEGTAKRW